MIICKNVSKTIDGRQIIDDVTVTFESGRIYGLRGKNGMGKTMLLRAISGLIRTTGEINVDGQVIGRDIDFPPSLGLLIENNNLLPEYTAKVNLELLARIKNVATEEMIVETLRRVGLDPDDKRTVRKFSLGMKQRLAIAQALFEKPDVILLDEPTNAIDVVGVEEIKVELLKERDRGATIIIASHATEDLDVLADEIMTISEGKIIENKSKK